MEEYVPLVRRMARNVAVEWPGVIEPDDLEQEIWVRLLESDSTLNKMGELDTRGQQGFLRLLGEQIAAGYRLDNEHFSGSFTYTTEDVRNLLRKGALHTRPEETRTDALSEHVDLNEALAALHAARPERAELIAAVYIDGREVGDDKKRLMRAVDDLTRRMNRTNKFARSEYDEGPGTRTVVSNATADYLTTKGYNQ